MRYFQKIAFGALALCMVAAMPLAASAAERTEGMSVEAFLTRVYTLTDHGAPRAGTTRGQYLSILYDAAGAPAVTGEPSFSDVSPDAHYASAVVWAEQKGIVRADRGRDFDPDAIVTTEETAQVLSAAVATLGETAQQLAQGILAAYSGYTKEEDFLLPPGKTEKEPRTVPPVAPFLKAKLRISRKTAPNSYRYVQMVSLPL